mmetsp:Transcript_35115/g.58722  ORF Transcript_35115/g.58722 Transcript_35115/m.58722 type:complete len:1182 (-) Transcript_35115:645-4190(-)
MDAATLSPYGGAFANGTTGGSSLPGSPELNVEVQFMRDPSDPDHPFVYGSRAFCFECGIKLTGAPKDRKWHVRAELLSNKEAGGIEYTPVPDFRDTKDRKWVVPLSATQGNRSAKQVTLDEADASGLRKTFLILDVVDGETVYNMKVLPVSSKRKNCEFKIRFALVNDSPDYALIGPIHETESFRSKCKPCDKDKAMPGFNNTFYDRSMRKRKFNSWDETLANGQVPYTSTDPTSPQSLVVHAPVMAATVPFDRDLPVPSLSFVEPVSERAVPLGMTRLSLHHENFPMPLNYAYRISVRSLQTSSSSRAQGQVFFKECFITETTDVTLLHQPGPYIAEAAVVDSQRRDVFGHPKAIIRFFVSADVAADEEISEESMEKVDRAVIEKTYALAKQVEQRNRVWPYPDFDPSQINLPVTTRNIAIQCLRDYVHLGLQQGEEGAADHRRMLNEPVMQHGNTVLHVASQLPDVPLVEELLLSYGVEARTRNARGNTAMHEAAFRRFREVLEVFHRYNPSLLLAKSSTGVPVSDLIPPDWFDLPLPTTPTGDTPAMAVGSGYEERWESEGSESDDGEGDVEMSSPSNSINNNMPTPSQQHQQMSMGGSFQSRPALRFCPTPSHGASPSPVPPQMEHTPDMRSSNSSLYRATPSNNMYATQQQQMLGQPTPGQQRPPDHASAALLALANPEAEGDGRPAPRLEAPGIPRSVSSGGMAWDGTAPPQMSTDPNAGPVPQQQMDPSYQWQQASQNSSMIPYQQHGTPTHMMHQQGQGGEEVRYAQQSKMQMSSKQIPLPYEVPFRPQTQPGLKCLDVSLTECRRGSRTPVPLRDSTMIMEQGESIHILVGGSQAHMYNVHFVMETTSLDDQSQYILNLLASLGMLRLKVELMLQEEEGMVMGAAWVPVESPTGEEPLVACGEKRGGGGGTGSGLRNQTQIMKPICMAKLIAIDEKGAQGGAIPTNSIGLPPNTPRSQIMGQVTVRLNTLSSHYGKRLFRLLMYVDFHNITWPPPYRINPPLPLSSPFRTTSAPLIKPDGTISPTPQPVPQQPQQGKEAALAASIISSLGTRTASTGTTSTTDTGATPTNPQATPGGAKRDASSVAITNDRPEIFNVFLWGMSSPIRCVARVAREKQSGGGGGESMGSQSANGGGGIVYQGMGSVTSPMQGHMGMNTMNNMPMNMPDGMGQM